MRRSSIPSVAQFAELGGTTSPVGNHFDEELKVNGALEQLLHLLPCPGADGSQHLASASDQDSLLALALHKNRCQHGQPGATGPRTGVFHDPLDLHRDGVGYFLPRLVQHLFADQFPQKGFFRLVADGFRRVEARSRWQISNQSLQEVICPQTGQGTYGMDGPACAARFVRSREQLPIRSDLPFSLGGFHQIPVVKGDMDRGAALPEEIHNVGISPSSFHGSVHEEENQIHFSDGLAGTFH